MTPRHAGSSPLLLRILGVGAAAALGVGTFATLGLAIAQTLYDRGVIGDKSSDGLGAIAYLGGGAIVGAVVGVVLAVWVGVRVWQSRWALLLVLLAASVITGTTLAITTFSA